ncbi:hypothetical protein Ddye_002976 [Dipteronia dyeriana]|uniref:Cytochrome b561 and DOMON domain-containing protein n=1 Tax=Dipteronia dyeriana TaxID=168575 RepID=A0AAD9XRW7_9ROSI|nr:hypothetical protein Ddye_002976 [Dipteronia dyeriana]
MEDTISLKFLFFACALFHFLVPSLAQTCKSYVFLNQNIYRSCNDLESLDSFLHWNYNQPTNTVDIAYRHTKIAPQRWVAWAVNPSGKGMVGSQALVAFQNAAGISYAHTSPVTSYNTRLENGDLSFQVETVSAEFANNEMIIYAKFVLPENVTRVNHVWQDGPVNEDYSLGRHALDADHLRSMGVVDFLSGQVVTTKGGSSRLSLKKAHGGINMISWGILLPMGMLIVRFMREWENPSWFYAHVICQSLGYTAGIVGAAIGFYLGVKSHGIQYDAHKYIGIVLLVLGFIQVLAGILRPGVDHDRRKQWKIFHLVIGYLVIILSVTNNFTGFLILKAMKIWMLTYVGFVILFFVLLVLSFNPIFTCKKAEEASA